MTYHNYFSEISGKKLLDGEPSVLANDNHPQAPKAFWAICVSRLVKYWQQNAP